MQTQDTIDQANHIIDNAATSASAAANAAAKLADEARHTAQRGVEALRESSQKLLDRAQRASVTTVDYVKDEPVKAMLIAAATGAALMALIGLLNRSRDRS